MEPGSKCVAGIVDVEAWNTWAQLTQTGLARGAPSQPVVGVNSPGVRCYIAPGRNAESSSTVKVGLRRSRKLSNSSCWSFGVLRQLGVGLDLLAED